VRNDCQPSDNTMTGVAVENAANFTTDTNKRLILEATGSKNGASRTLSVVIQNLNLSWNTALGFPGVQADVNFSGSSFTIDGRDTKMTDTIGSPTGSNPVVFGITTSVAGNTASIQTALANNQQNDVWGKNPSGSGTVHGDSAVTTDTVILTSQAVTTLVNQVKAMADITINSSSANPYSITGMGGTCASNWADSTCWGTDAKPKIVYVNATLSDQNQEYTSLSISGGSGTGILIVQNGHVNITGDFNWHGPIIVTGNNVGMVYRGGGSNGIYGAVVVNELRNDGATNLEGDIRGNAKIAYSKDALDLVTNALSRKLIQMTAWREK
jgi:hypothetical protein